MKTAACVCGSEVVDPRIQSTMDAAALAAMTERWAPCGLRVIGPVGLDLAISTEACRHKGYVLEGGVRKKIPQTGIVEIGDDVEIGANTTIDRARFGRTLIGEGAKIDNLVQIAHNVQIGSHTTPGAVVTGAISGTTLTVTGVLMTSAHGQAITSRVSAR